MDHDHSSHAHGKCPVQSLYDKYGGEDTIEKVVDSFYVKVLADERVKHFFEHTDMKKQRKHQTNFICFALGGPKSYTGKTMRAAHEKMELKDLHFDTIVELLGKTLAEFGVAAEDISAIATKIEGLRKDILNQ